MNYPNHWYIRAKSRGYNVEDMTEMHFFCEIPWCNKYASEIHHIECSYRGSKKRHEAPNQLIALCKYHHDRIHSYNDFENRQRLLFIVKKYENIPQQQESNNWLNKVW